MKPARCPLCQSTDLVPGRIGYPAGFFMATIAIVFRPSFFKMVDMTCSACLACGAIIPYLDDAALAKLRTWDDRTRPPKPPRKTLKEVLDDL